MRAALSVLPDVAAQRRATAVALELLALASRPRTLPSAAAAMKFRPCIDIHDGVVKQIVGGSLRDAAGGAADAAAPTTNFVATKPAAEFAR